MPKPIRATDQPLPIRRALLAVANAPGQDPRLAAQMRDAADAVQQAIERIERLQRLLGEPKR